MKPRDGHNLSTPTSWANVSHYQEMTRWLPGTHQVPDWPLRPQHGGQVEAMGTGVKDRLPTELFGQGKFGVSC